MALVAVAKILRRVGANCNLAVEVFMTVSIVVFASTTIYTVGLLLKYSFTSYVGNFAATLMATVILTSLIVRIVLKGADANEQHSLTRDALLDYAVTHRDSGIQDLIPLMDHMDSVDSVSVLGLRCTRLLVKKVFVLSFSLISLVMRTAGEAQKRSK